ncbi:Cytochrome c-552 [compost metagenome]
MPIYPNLAGQNAPYLLKQLKAFKDGQRKDPMMAPFMAPLTEADLENLAAYYASLKQ